MANKKPSTKPPELHFAAARLAGESSLHTKKFLAQFSYGRLLWDNPGGRHANFDEAAASRMRAELRDFCLRHQTAWPGRLPTPSKLKNFVMDKLLPNAGVSSSYRIAKERIVAPVLRELRPQRRKNK